MEKDTGSSIKIKQARNVGNEKIGIATFHCAQNYGAFLQAFALQKWLQMREDVNKEVRIINYRPSYLIEPYRIRIHGRINKNASFVKRCKAMIAFIAEVPYRLIKKARYRQAEHFLSLTEPFFSSEISLDSSYKALILGSDQIWNINLTQGIDRVYFGKIADIDCRKIAYAASIGVSKYPAEIEEEVGMCLSQLDSIGVREKASIRILKPLCDSTIELNVDPTLLVSPSFWKECIRKTKYNDYILVYQVSTDTRIMKDAYRIAKKNKKKILHFGDPSIKPVFRDVKVKSLAYCGPFDFISYISKANVILTDSFHATCFSVIFCRNFYTYLQVSRSERLRSLAEIGGFTDRLLEYGQTLNEQQMDQAFADCTEDYNVKFIMPRNQSEMYLAKSLEGIK